jgi:hypothetical protein
MQKENCSEFDLKEIFDGIGFYCNKTGNTLESAFESLGAHKLVLIGIDESEGN